MDEAKEISLRAGQIFKPTTPVTTQELFAGRIQQIQDVLDTIAQQGQHAIVFGERGVGKTSLSYVIRPILSAIGPQDLIISHVTANTRDTFGSLWNKAFNEVTWKAEIPKLGFSSELRQSIASLANEVGLPDNPRPDDVRRALYLCGRSIFIFDEYDRLPGSETTVMTDLIKMLSDHIINSTIVMVGVADSVKRLIRGHASIDRSLKSIPMPRMSREELADVLKRASEQLGVEFTNAAATRIVQLSNGLPHYPHLLGLHAVRNACKHLARQVDINHVKGGVQKAVRDKDATIQGAYVKATRSSASDAIYEPVLLACALAAKDELGFFKPKNVIRPLKSILNRSVNASTFRRHLGSFCKRDRGTILEKHGKQYRPVYRFKDPLLPPYAILRGLAESRISEEKLKSLIGSEI